MADFRSNESLSSAQSTTVEWLLARVAGAAAPPLSLDDMISPSWRSQAVAQLAVEMAVSLASGCSVEGVRKRPDGEVHCLLKDPRGRQRELFLTFEGPRSGRLSRLSTAPTLAEGVEVRPPRPEDIEAMTELELAAPVVRDDGTEVIIDHNGKQFDHQRLVREHRLLGAFRDGRMLAVQGVGVATAPIGGTVYRLAGFHYSRSDPRSRNAGNLMHLIATLNRDVFPQVDQFLSFVDAQNAVGLRLSFGMPWPTRVHRLFLPVSALTARQNARPRYREFDAEHVATLLNITHEGMNLWVPRTPRFLVQRHHRAPAVYRPECWRITDHAALALWPSGERRIYRKDGKETVRTLALAIDYGFDGRKGRDELTGLLCEAAREVVGQGFSHIAVFISDGHPATQWLADLADASDVYAICAPSLEDPAPPSGPVYMDHILF